MGHARLAAITDEAEAVWIESVVIHPEARGKGVGKYLMLRTEQFSEENLGAKKAYLSTTDQQIFYSKIGYSFCPPVTYYSGNVNLPKPKPMPKSKKELVTNSVPRVPNSAPLSEAKNIPPPPPMKIANEPPPPPPPPMMIPKCEKSDAKELKFEDISVTCSKVFRKLSHKDVTEVPSFSKPLAKLTANEKKGTCKATMQKDYMVKIF